MALEVQSGDVFNELLKKQEAGEEVIFVHGCNAQGVMGSGVASPVKKLYPFAYDQYRQEHKDFGLVLGDVVFANEDGCFVHVANAITQQYYGRDGSRYVDYEAVITSLQKVAKSAKVLNVPVYLPMIGGGLGGGDTKRLVAIFQAIFHDVDATLFLKEG